jgi:hypothetical protein
VVIVGASGGRISMVNVSVSVARVWSLTWTVNVKLPAAVGTPGAAREVEELCSGGKAAIDDFERQ